MGQEFDVRERTGERASESTISFHYSDACMAGNPAEDNRFFPYGKAESPFLNLDDKVIRVRRGLEEGKTTKRV